MKKIILSPMTFIVLWLLSLTTSTHAQTGFCAGLSVNGDYSYEVYSLAGTVYFTFHPLPPIAGSSSAIIYLKEGTASGTYPGYNMVPSGADFTYSKAIADGTITSFYFSYNVPAGGENNSSADPHGYIAGASCEEGAPTVSITSPIEAASFTAPADIIINATALDIDGTVTKVEFYKNNILIGMDDTSPYSFNWTNVTAEAYILVAKATDNNGLVTNSVPVNIIVNTPNTNGYCGTAFSGEYEYKAETNGDQVTFTFHPLPVIAGCAYALIYIQQGGSGGFAGNGMAASGTDFIYSQNIADGTLLSIYFTYNLPGGGENNSSANPHNYVVGENCTGIAGVPPTISITSPVNNAGFTEPATIPINVTAGDLDGSVTKVEFYSGATYLGMDNSSPYTVNWNNVLAGNYTITAKATDNSSLFTVSSLINIVVSIDNTSGFCDTIANGDYSYKAETINGNVVFTFHPLQPILGSAYALIYIDEIGNGVYPGYPMTAIGADFRFTKAIANGTPLSIYFTYNLPGGGENNSSATPHSYTVGTECVGTVSINETEAINHTVYPNPVNDRLFIKLSNPDNSLHDVQIINPAGQVLISSPEFDIDKGIDIRTLKPGIYFLHLKQAQTKQVFLQKFIKA